MTARTGLNFHMKQKQAILNANSLDMLDSRYARGNVLEFLAKLPKLLDYARLRPLADASIQERLL